ncbi:M3 family metallopeptidase [Paenibacillus elgii]|uniref:M3 family metallopeptidase n=1 Tax=Paenibacillus elgii TaxID=189691 RepID=UPI0002F18967|nr:M3 family metallopeptidase [Paenibacillus elgii]
MNRTDKPTCWDLSSIYPNGMDKAGFIQILDRLKVSLDPLEKNSHHDPVHEPELRALSEIMKQIEKAEYFSYCLSCEDMEPDVLHSLQASITALKSQARIILSNWWARVRTMTKAQLDALTEQAHPNLISDLLSGYSNADISKINSEKEALKNLEEAYMQLRNKLMVAANGLEEGNELSFSKAVHLSMAHPDSSTREKAFSALNSALSSQADDFSSVFNQMIGRRLRLYKLLNEEDYLGESLRMNGLSRATLETMQDVIRSNRTYLTKFLNRRAQEANKEKLSWHELMTSSQDVNYQVPYSKAVVEITAALGAIDPNMSEFTHDALQRGWVDSEPRDSKAPGGFCVPFIGQGESRVSVNYDDTMDSARILAHELGHAWHFKQMKSVPSLRFLDETLEMTTAETASIFFEAAYIDFVIRNTDDLALKKSLLGWSIERSLNYLMAIMASFEFEKRFYDQRREGPLSADQIEQISLQAQEEVYGESLTEYQPYVWMKYAQFYQADVPFYNYPYTFGYLLSIGLLERARTTNVQFSAAFQSFLSQTGTLPVEQLVKKHFHIDLAQPEFWQQSMTKIQQDIEEYLRLSKAE